MTTTTTQHTYRLGSLLQGELAALANNARQEGLSFPRPLIRQTDDKTVGYVSSDAGPAVVGSLTRDEVIERFGRESFCGSY